MGLYKLRKSLINNKSSTNIPNIINNNNSNKKSNDSNIKLDFINLLNISKDLDKNIENNNGKKVVSLIKKFIHELTVITDIKGDSLKIKLIKKLLNKFKEHEDLLEKINLNKLRTNNRITNINISNEIRKISNKLNNIKYNQNVMKQKANKENKLKIQMNELKRLTNEKNKLLEERQKILNENNKKINNEKNRLLNQEINNERNRLLNEKKELELNNNKNLEEYKKKTTLVNIYNNIETDEMIEKKQKILNNYPEILQN